MDELMISGTWATQYLLQAVEAHVVSLLFYFLVVVLFMERQPTCTRNFRFLEVILLTESKGVQLMDAGVN